MSIYNAYNLKTSKNVASGISEFMLIALVSDFEQGGIKCPEAPFANPGDLTKITSPHVFKQDKAFAQILFAPEKNELSAKTIGDTGFNKFDFEMVGVIPGSYSELHEAMGQYLNQPVIVLVKDSNCDANMWYQLGCDCVFARITSDFTTGNTKSGIKGYTVKVTYQNAYVQTYDVPGGPIILGD